MSGSGDALEAIVGLALGGIIFIVFGSALGKTALDGSTAFVNFEFWGAIYIIGAFLLAVVFVIGAVLSLLNSL